MKLPAEAVGNTDPSSPIPTSTSISSSPNIKQKKKKEKNTCKKLIEANRNM